MNIDLNYYKKIPNKKNIKVGDYVEVSVINRTLLDCPFIREVKEVLKDGTFTIEPIMLNGVPHNLIGYEEDEFDIYRCYEEKKHTIDNVPKKVDNVNSPKHYNMFKQEVIDTIEDWTKGYENPFVGYLIGNTLKYLSRAPYKNNLEEDMKKAEWYLKKTLKYINKNNS